MKKIVKYELTQEERQLLIKCVHEGAQNCDGDCRNGCPFYLEREDWCILERLDKIVDSCD